MSSILDRLRGKPKEQTEADKYRLAALGDEKEQRRREHEQRKKEIEREEKQARFEGYKAGRIKGAREHAYKKGYGSTATLGERLSGTGGTAHRVGKAFSGEMNELGNVFGMNRQQPQPRRKGAKKKPVQQQPRRSDIDDMKWIME